MAWQDNRQVYSQMEAPSGYITCGVNWQADYISFYVDGKSVGKQATPSDMHSSMYLLLDLATQGADHASNNADAAGVLLSSYVDYVRVYSYDPTTKAVALQTVSSPDGHDPGLYSATAASPAVVTPSPVPAVSSQTAAVSGSDSGPMTLFVRPVLQAGKLPGLPGHSFGPPSPDPSAGIRVRRDHKPDLGCGDGAGPGRLRQPSRREYEDASRSKGNPLNARPSKEAICHPLLTMRLLLHNVGKQRST